MSAVANRLRRAAEHPNETDSSMLMEHETIESFYRDEYGDHLLIRDRAANLWLGWESEDGVWYVVRPRNEEDPDGPDGDRWRPVGPALLETLLFPIIVVVAHDVLRPGGPS